ncbi:MAG TPA: hypothetical protein VFN55_17105 [Solirubrobacteraceae bacterium]|nr:hypothetical protein [Solirubrobacteraceae bacterium]
MSDTTMEPPRVHTGDPAAPAAGAAAPRRSPLRRYAWWLVAVAVVAISVVLVLVARTRPGYDPYGWLDWGYQTLRGTLDLGGAPSWKPFSYVFTLPFSLFGHYALWLWMFTSVSISLSGSVFGGRIAYRVVARESDARWPPIVAAIVGGACVLGIQDYFHYLLSNQSDSMLVAVALAALDQALCGRYRWAYWLGILGSLGRPEFWPPVFLFTLWAWRERPEMRKELIGGPIVVAFLWFGVPTITNDRPNIAGQLALRSPRECKSNKIVCTTSRFFDLDILPVQLAALASLLIAAVRRNWAVLGLWAVLVLWVLTEIGFALHGFPGVPRYLFEAAGLMGVLAGVGVGLLLADASRLWARLPRLAGVPVAAVLVAFMIPSAISQARAEHKDIRHEQARTKEINKLSAFLTALGGPKHVEACGRPVLNVEYVSIMGWYVHRNTGTIGYRPQVEVWDRRYPLVLFSTFPNGWAVQTVRTAPAMKAACANLNAFYVPTARHPGGALVPHAPLPLPPRPVKRAGQGSSGH